MSQKTECPACHSYLSAITYAFEAGEPCPQCGLSASSALEVLTLRAKTNDEAAQAAIAAALVRADKAERENRALRDRLTAIQRALDEIEPRDD